MKYNPQKHHRQSIRLQNYDYTRVGAYFVTIVTQGRECLFGEIIQSQMNLSARGKIAEECWLAIPEHFPFVELGAYVVMPNHVHGIIVIAEVGAQQCCAPTMDDPSPHKINVKPGSLGAIVRSYKSAVTYISNKAHGPAKIWQRNYYEHVIRDSHAMENITHYIEANPSRWNDDDENPNRKRP